MGESKLYSYEVSFKGNRRDVYYSEQEIKRGSFVIVNVEKGLDAGKVSTSKLISADEAKTLPKIHRLATGEDVERIVRNNEKEKNAFRLCKERIIEHKLEMKLVEVEMQFDGGKLTFYFTSPQRVDFRELVKSLAGIYHTRIDLRQIGARDEARLISGIGPCGRVQCCSSCMNGFAEITAQQAKDQQLSMNPIKISGNCGRYLCCLSFEQECYLDAYTRIPRTGSLFVASDGRRGEVVFVDIFKERVQVKFIVKNKEEKPTATYEWFDTEQINAGKVEETKQSSPVPNNTSHNHKHKSEEKPKGKDSEFVSKK
jgi:cell fate regulator YaaT (PSP1 superfamily)